MCYYRQVWKRKDIDLKKLRTAEVIERFLSKCIQIESGCWLWQASVGTSGYGVFGFDGTMYSAHVISYLLFVGDISEGLEVKHKDCNSKVCVCPEHLCQGTHASNIVEMSIAGRAKTPITNEDVLAIRASNKSDFFLAKEFGVSPRTIYNIRQRKTRKYI